MNTIAKAREKCLFLRRAKVGRAIGSKKLRIKFQYGKNKLSGNSFKQNSMFLRKYKPFSDRSMANRFEYLTSLLESSPQDSFLLFALAKECEKMNNPDGALEYYLRLVSADPDYVGLYYHLGKLYEQKQQPENAIQAYRQGIAVSKKAGDHHAASELTGALLNLEDPDE